MTISPSVVLITAPSFAFPGAFSSLELAFFSVLGSGLVSFFVSWAWAVTRPKTALKAQIDTAIFISPQNLPLHARNVTPGISATPRRLLRQPGAGKGRA